jgi:hypothetical protein
VPEEDDGWGGRVDEGWLNANAPAPVQQPYGAPAQYGTPPAPAPAPAPAPSRSPLRNPVVLGGIALVVAAAVVFVVILATSGSGGGSPVSQSSGVVPTTTTTTTGSSTGSTGSGLLSSAPFADCQQAPKESYDTATVTDQIVCAGSDVEAESAQGVSYARFPDDASLQTWYQQTLLGANGIQTDQGNCTSGQTVQTTRGAAYCESSFTDSTGSSARQVLIEAPAGVTLTNGPNSSSTDCPSSSFTVLAFTSPSNHVGVTAVTCSASSTIATGLERAVTNGSFSLKG